MVEINDKIPFCALKRNEGTFQSSFPKLLLFIVYSFYIFQG